MGQFHVENKAKRITINIRNKKKAWWFSLNVIDKIIVCYTAFFFIDFIIYFLYQFDKIKIKTKSMIQWIRVTDILEVCIVVAVDDDRKIIAKPVSVGRLDSIDARNLLL